MNPILKEPIMSTKLGDFRNGRRLGIRDARLVERALGEHWPIPEGLRGRVMDRLGAIVDDTEASHRAITAAARALLGASKINLESVAAVMKADEYESLGDRVEALERSASLSPAAREELAHTPGTEGRVETP
jgi:hypothetical protein